MQLLEGRIVPTIFDVIDSKANDSFEAAALDIEDIYSAQAAGAVRILWSGSYDRAIAAGPLPNQVTGAGATVFDAHRDYITGWQASETLAASQVLPSPTEIALKNLGDLTKGSLRNTLSSPTVQFEVGMAAVCWIVNPFSAGVLTPWCSSLTVQAARTFAVEFAVDFMTQAGHQAIDNLDISQANKDLAHSLINVTATGYELFDSTKSFLDATNFTDAPDLLERVYRRAESATEFIGWVDSLGDVAEDLLRANDPATSGLTAATLMSSAIQFQGRRTGEAVLSLAAQRPLTDGEKKAVRGLFTDSNFTTGFLGFTPTQANQILQAIGPLNEFVRVQDGQALVLGTDGADTIDVFSAVDVTGAVEITVNGGQTVVLPRSTIPNGVAIYSRGGGDNVSVRADVASFISAGAGNDTVVGGWGPDVIRGGPGDDLILGRDGDDVLRGDAGNDEIRGGAGNNILNGGAGSDIVIDNHQLIPFEQIVTPQKLAPAPTGQMPILTNVTATPNPVQSNGKVTITAVGASGNGGALLRFEVWEFGQGGKLLGVDETATDGLAVTFDASAFGSTGTHKTISHVYGTNGIASNWVARDVIVTSPPPTAPVITSLIRTPNPVQQGQTLTLQAQINDPSSTVNFVQFVWDRDGSDTVTTGDTILGNGSPLSGGVSTFTVSITEAYATGVQRFLTRARHSNNTQWSNVKAGAVVVDPPPNSAPGVTSLTPSSTILVRGLTLTLTANVVPGQFPTTEVHFYRDSNGNGVLDPATDTDLGNDTSSSGGWKLTFSTSPFPLGSNTFFARAEDGKAHTDYVIGTTTVTLTNPDTQGPQATLQPTINITTPGGTAYGFQVTYTDDVAIEFDELSDGDVQVTGPMDIFYQLGTLVNVDTPSDGTPRTVTYMIIPPGGSWNAADNGTYTISVRQNQVSDTTAHYLAFAALGTFTVNIPDDTPPTVSLNALSTDVANPTVKTVSTFSVSGSASDPESGIVVNRYHFFVSAFVNGVWSEPDDRGTSGSSISLSNLADGLYAITLQAENGAGLTSSSTVGYVFVDAVNSPPNAANDAASVAEDSGATAVDVLGNDSTPDLSESLTILSVNTSGTQGTVQITGGGTGVTFTPTANFNGTTTFTYTVGDGTAGSTATATVTMTVTPVNDPPTAGPDTATVAEDSGATVIDVLANDGIAPDAGESLTVTAVTQPTHGSVTLVGGVIRYAPTSNYDGPDSFTYTIGDGNGGSATATVNVTVTAVNDPPVLAPIGNRSGDEGTVLTFTATATDIDVPANALTFSLIGAPSWAAIDAASGVFAWTPTESQGPGNFTFRVRVTDNGSPALFAEEELTVAIAEVNRPPLLGSIGNRSVDEGQMLTFVVSGTDPDLPANTLMFSATGLPSGASFDSATRTFAWTPSENQDGTHSVTFMVSDGSLTASETVAIVVREVNSAPVLAAVSDVTVDESTLYTFTATATDSDLPANGLTFTLIGAPSGAAIDGASGVFNWTPTEAQGAGSYPITIRVTDNGSPVLFDSRTITISVREVNLAPVLAAIGDRTVQVGQTLQFTASATDPDQLANSRTFRLVGAANGMSIDPNTGVFTWAVPANAAAGTFPVTIVVDDNGAPVLSDAETIAVTISTPPPNTPPTVSDVADRTIPENGTTGALGFTIGDAETPAANLAVTFGSSNATLVPTGAMALGGSGANRTITVTPAVGMTGSATITITVTDAGNLITTDTFVLTVTSPPPPNTSPTVSDVGDQSTLMNTTVGPIGFVVSDNESSSALLTVTATSSTPSLLPDANIVLNGSGASRTMTLTPAANQFGTVTVTLTVRDPGGLTATDTFTITVLPLPPNPGLVGSQQFAVGTDRGGSPAVRFFNPDGTQRLAQSVFDASFMGGVRTTAADFNTDGVADIVVGTGPGVPTLVRVLDGVDGHELFRVAPFEPSFLGGVYVAAGDVTGDDVADLVITPDEGGGPRVELFRGGDFRQVGNFFGIDDPSFRGGARAAVGDLTGDGVGDLIISAGFGGGPRISTYDGNALTQHGQFVHPVSDFFLFEPGLRNGAFVAAGDVNGDGFADVIGGGGPGGGPRVYVLGGKELMAGQTAVLANFFAGNTENRGGIRVSVKNLDGDRFADLLVGDGAGAGSHVTAYHGVDFHGGGASTAFAFDAFPGFGGGVFVG